MRVDGGSFCNGCATDHPAHRIVCYFHMFCSIWLAYLDNMGEVLTRVNGMYNNDTAETECMKWNMLMGVHMLPEWYILMKL